MTQAFTRSPMWISHTFWSSEWALNMQKNALKCPVILLLFLSYLRPPFNFFFHSDDSWQGTCQKNAGIQADVRQLPFADASFDTAIDKGEPSLSLFIDRYHERMELPQLFYFLWADDPGTMDALMCAKGDVWVRASNQASPIESIISTPKMSIFFLLPLCKH